MQFYSWTHSQREEASGVQTAAAKTSPCCGSGSRVSCGTVSAKEGLEPSLLLSTQQRPDPYCLCKSSSNPAISSALLAPAEIREHKMGIETAGPVVLQNA